MKKIFKILSLVLATMLTTICMFSCDFVLMPGDDADSTQEKEQTEEEKLKEQYGENYRKDLETPIDGRFCGMCYLSWEMRYKANVDVATDLLANMGVQTVRHWMHFGYLMSDYQTLKEDCCEEMHSIIQKLQDKGIFLIGMSHTNWNLDKQSFEVGKPNYEYWDDSYYEWLECYETSWYTMAKEFPEITYWEIDNEINNKDFMYSFGVSKVLDMQTMACIALDMMYYASRGIHRANPENVTVMGSLVDPYGLGIETAEGNTMAKYLEILYDEIDNGSHGSYYADDFFQTACWHPYYYTKAPDDYFYEQNDKLYEIVKRREGKDKKVYLTEIGYVERFMQSEAKTVEAVTKLYTEAKEKLPYVEAICFHRMFDNLEDNGNDAGMFYDPSESRDDYSYTTKERMNPGSPKAMAYAFQQAAGGSGSLTLFDTYYALQKK